VDQRKVSLISEFLEDAFVGCSVHALEAKDGDATQFYQIVHEATDKILHRVFVSREFFDAHAEAEIVPALQDLALLFCLRMAGLRRVIVRSERIEIEQRP
jgi:hypothetical protein